MRKLIRPAFSALLGAVTVSPAMPLAAQNAETVAFVNVNVLPMDRADVLPDQTVVVRGGRITAIGPAAATQVPQGATRVDGRGKFLMPGIAEMHGHVPGIGPDGQNRQWAEDVLFLYVAAGATTVRGMQGHASQLDMRRRIEAGELIGPRMFLAAPPLAGTGGNAVTDPEVARQRIREAKQAGFDLLKVHEGLSPDVYAAIVDEATKQGLPWGGHVSDFVGLEGALAARQSTVDHLDNYLEALVPGYTAGTPVQQLVQRVDESRIPELARATREAGVAVVPTQSLWETLMGAYDAASLSARSELRYVPRNMVQGWVNAQNQSYASANQEAVTKLLQLRNRMLDALSEAGAIVLMGTDAPQRFSVPGFALYRELPVMVQAGMTPYEVLVSGTSAVAKFFGIEAEAGTIAVGKRADLILLDANPLQDIRNIERRAGVMVNGRWLPEAEIRRRLDEIAARYTGG